MLAPAVSQPLETLKKLEHEYSLRDGLNSAWAVRSLARRERVDVNAVIREMALLQQEASAASISIRTCGYQQLRTPCVD